MPHLGPYDDNDHEEDRVIDVEFQNLLAAIEEQKAKEAEERPPPYFGEPDDLTSVIAAAVEAGNAQPDYGEEGFGEQAPAAADEPGFFANLLGKILPKDFNTEFVPPRLALAAKILGVDAAPATAEQIAANNAEQAALEQEQEASGFTPEGNLIDQLPENLPGGGVQPPVAPLPAPPRIVTPTPTPTALPGTDARIAGLLNLFAGTQAPRAPQFTPQAPQAPGIGLLQQLTGLNQAQPSLGQLIQGS